MSASVPQGKTAPRPNGFVCRAGRSFLRRRRKAVRFMKYVGEIWRCAALYRTEQYEKLGIGCYQDQYLVKICEQPGISQEEIAESLFVHKSNVARQVAALEENGFRGALLKAVDACVEKGFVERRPDAADKRILRAYPTEKAQAVAEEIRRIRSEWTRRLLEGMSEEEKAAASQLMCRLAERAKTAAREYQEEK